MASRSSSGWRSTMSISLSPSRYWPIVLPDRMVRDACAMPWLVTPSARALSWSMSRRSTLTDSFQLSLTPRMRDSRAADPSPVGPGAHWPRRADDAELHRIRHRRPVGQQLDAAAHLRELLASSAGRRGAAPRARPGLGSRMNWLTLVCGKIWSSGR
jgi:hypothetical protein